MVFNFRAVESWRGSISKYISYSFVRGIKIRWENKNKEWEWGKETEAQLKSARRTNFNAGEAYGLSLFLRRSIPTQKGSDTERLVYFLTVISSPFRRESAP